MSYYGNNKSKRVTGVLRTMVLREWMDKNNKTIDGLSTMLGVSSRTVKYWLDGRKVTLPNRKKLCKVTELQPRVLFIYSFS